MQIKIISHPTSLALWLLLLLLFSGALQLSALSAKGYEQDQPAVWHVLLKSYLINGAVFFQDRDGIIH